MKLAAEMSLNTAAFTGPLAAATAAMKTATDPLRGMADENMRVFADLRKELFGSAEAMTQIAGQARQAGETIRASFGSSLRSTMGRVTSSIAAMSGPIAAALAGFNEVRAATSKIEAKNLLWLNRTNEFDDNNAALDEQLKGIDSVKKKKEALADIDKQISSLSRQRTAADQISSNEGFNSWRKLLGLSVDTSKDEIVGAIDTQLQHLRFVRMNLSRVSDDDLNAQSAARNREENQRENKESEDKLNASLHEAERSAAFELRLDAAPGLQKIDVIRERLEELSTQLDSLKSIDISIDPAAFNEYVDQREALEKERLQLQNKMSKLQRMGESPSEDPAKRLNVLKIDTDRYTKVGLYSSQNGAPALPEHRRTAVATERSAKSLAAIEQKIDRLQTIDAVWG